MVSAANADVTSSGPTASTVSIVGESGDNVLDNGTDLWRAGPDRVSVGRLYSSGVTVDAERGASGDTDDFTFEFQPPANQTLTAGTTYGDAQRMPAGTVAGLDVYGNGAGCNTESGQFTVLDIAPDLSRLWIVYEAHCEAGVPAAFGEIRYNEPVDTPGEVVAPGQISWPQKFVGQAAKQVPVTVINIGTAPLDSVRDVGGRPGRCRLHARRGGFLRDDRRRGLVRDQRRVHPLGHRAADRDAHGHRLQRFPPDSARRQRGSPGVHGQPVRGSPGNT